MLTLTVKQTAAPGTYDFAVSVFYAIAPVGDYKTFTVTIESNPDCQNDVLQLDPHGDILDDQYHAFVDSYSAAIDIVWPLPQRH